MFCLVAQQEEQPQHQLQQQRSNSCSNSSSNNNNQCQEIVRTNAGFPQLQCINVPSGVKTALIEKHRLDIFACARESTFARCFLFPFTPSESCSLCLFTLKSSKESVIPCSAPRNNAQKTLLQGTHLSRTRLIVHRNNNHHHPPTATIHNYCTHTHVEQQFCLIMLNLLLVLQRQKQDSVVHLLRPPLSTKPFDYEACSRCLSRDKTDIISIGRTDM